jgi:hypothetical protein
MMVKFLDFLNQLGSFKIMFTCKMSFLEPLNRLAIFKMKITI